MSDLLTPLFLVCVQPFAADPLRCDVAALDSAILADIEVSSFPTTYVFCLHCSLDLILLDLTWIFSFLVRQADVYWCFSKLLDNIQDHYTFSQPGLQRMVTYKFYMPSPLILSSVLYVRT